MIRFIVLALLLIACQIDDSVFDDVKSCKKIYSIGSIVFEFESSSKLISMYDTAATGWFEVEFIYGNGGHLEKSRYVGGKGGDAIVSYDSLGNLKQIIIPGGTTGLTKFHWIDGLLKSKSFFRGDYGNTYPDEPQNLLSSTHYKYNQDSLVIERLRYNFNKGVKIDSIITYFEYTSFDNVLFEYRNELIAYFGDIVLSKQFPSTERYEYIVKEECLTKTIVEPTYIEHIACINDYKIKLVCE